MRLGLVDIILVSPKNILPFTVTGIKTVTENFIIEVPLYEKLTPSTVNLIRKTILLTKNGCRFFFMFFSQFISLNIVNILMCISVGSGKTCDCHCEYIRSHLQKMCWLQHLTEMYILKICHCILFLRIIN